MNIEKIKITKLKPNKANPRIIKDDKFYKLVDSLFVLPKMLELRPIVVDVDMTILGGNMRLRALQSIARMAESELRNNLSRLGRDDMADYWLAWQDVKDAPVVRASELTDAEKREFIIKDNSQFGSWDWDMLANEWEQTDLTAWGVDLPTEWESGLGGGRDEEAEIERKRQEFEERIKAGELSEEDEEYQEFLDKFKLKKTTDDCYTPTLIYEAVADWVAKEYKVSRADFVRPFYPGGDYQREDYPKGCVVVDNPPFSILAEILNFYKNKGIRFFLFAPTLTLFSSSSSSSCTALCIAGTITYDNGAGVATSFLTNLEPKEVRLKSNPELYRVLKAANDKNLKSLHKELPKYSYDHHIITAPFVGTLSRLGIEFSVPVSESETISAMDSQKESGKAIYGKGYIVSDRVFAEREKAEREKAEREKAEREKAEREKAEREKAERWELSDRERAIIARLNRNSK